MQHPPPDASADSAGATGRALERVVRLTARSFGAAAALVGVDVVADGTEPVGCAVLAIDGLDAASVGADALFLQRAAKATAPVAADCRDFGHDATSLRGETRDVHAGLALAVGKKPGSSATIVLCVFDVPARRFTATDGELLAELGAMAREELGREGDDLEGDGNYRSIFENAVEGFYQSLPNGRFLSVNPALARLLGYATPGEMLAATVDPAKLYVEAGRREEFQTRIDAEGALSGWESEVYRADGTRRWISEHARAIRDEDGRVLRYEGTFEDITSRRDAEEALRKAHDELEDRVRERTAELAMLNATLRQHILEREFAESASRRSESKFRALIENAQDLISVLTPDGISLYQSPSVEHLLGFTPEELIGRNVFQELIHPEDLAAVQAASDAIVEGGERYVRVESRYRHRDGTWRLLESIGSSAPPDSPIIGWVLNSRDITERRQVELEHEARTREQTAVAELGRYALDDRPLTEIFRKTAEVVARALEVPFAVVGELQADGETLLIRAGVGWRENAVGRTFPRGPWLAYAEEAAGSAGNGSTIVGDVPAEGWCSGVWEPADGLDAPRSAISVVIHCDGRPFGSLSALAPVPGRFGGRDALFLQTVADLLSAVIESERHRAASREVQARYERIAANTPGMVYQAIRRVDGTGSVTFVSEGCRQLYGLEPAQIMARPELLNELIHPDDQGHALSLLAESNAHITPLQWEGRLVHPTGEVRWITARSRPEQMPNGDIYRDGLVFDVTELKHAQEDMRAAKEEAEKANRAKSEFLSRMSHELRTPLNAILGFGQLLGLEQLTPVQNSSLEQILKGGRHLLDLINEVLDITRIEAGRMEMSLEPVDVMQVVNEALQFVRPLGEQYQITLSPPTMDGQPAVIADRGRLHQVFLNLLSNAVKYNRAGGEVRVKCARGDGETVRMSITDTGPGLAPEQIELLFMPFQRLDAAQRGIAGTGIGLTITRSLVAAMGGHIAVESTPGVGTTFHVDLPGAPQEAVAPPPRMSFQDIVPKMPEQPQDIRARTILLIDDQNANVSLVERVLETRENLRLFTASDGRTGLTLARRQAPDLILLDLHLPDIPGDEVMRRLRHEPRTRHVPVIVVSADATPAQLARLKELGARDYLTKPFRIRELLGAIDGAFDVPTRA